MYSPRMAENTVGGWLECVFRPCYRHKKHTKPASWPINLNLCPHGLESELDYAYGLHIPQTLSQASGMAYI